MSKLKKELIDLVINTETVPFNRLDDYWVITLDGRLFAPSHGTCFFETKEKAWKCWYMQTHYRIKHKYKQDIAKQSGCNDMWKYSGGYPMNDRAVWEAFKSQLYEYYGLKIIQWKDAKRNVYGESRTEGDC